MTAHAPQDNRTNLDTLAIAVSSLCLIHCLAGPAVLLLAPALFNPHGNVVIHFVLALIVLGLASVTLGRGYQHHRRSLPVKLGLIGSALLLLAFLVNDLHHSHSEINFHIVSTVLGSCFLIAAHITNLRACPACISKPVSIRSS